MSAPTLAPPKEIEQVPLDQVRPNLGTEATDLLDQYHQAGWSSRVGAKGHIFLKAPDGLATASLSRNTGGRMLKNAAAPLRRWLKQRVEEQSRVLTVSQNKPQAPTNAFGIDTASASTLIGQLGTEGVPPRIMRQLSEDVALVEYIRKLASRGKSLDERLLLMADTDPALLRQWVVADTAADTVVAHGDEITTEEAYRQLIEAGKIRPRKGNKAATTPETSMQMHVCPQCKEQFESAAKVNLHVLWKHEGFTCKECGENFGAPRSLAIHRLAKHGELSPQEERRQAAVRLGVPDKPDDPLVCRWCDRRFTAASGRANHEHKHIADGDLGPLKRAAAVKAAKTLKSVKKTAQEATPAGDVMVTSADVIPVVVPDVAPGVDLTEARADLSEVLGTLPTGGDAQDMVAKIRAIVTPPLVGELLALRREVEKLKHDNAILTKENQDVNARLALMREALGA